MAYQNTGASPRFFIDNYQYLRAMGLDPEEVQKIIDKYKQQTEELKSTTEAEKEYIKATSLHKR